MNIFPKQTSRIHRHQFAIVAVMTTIFVSYSGNQLLASTGSMTDNPNHNWLTAIKRADVAISNVNNNLFRRQFRNQPKTDEKTTTMSQLFRRSRCTNISR